MQFAIARLPVQMPHLFLSCHQQPSVAPFVGSKVNLTDFSISAGYGEFAGKLVAALREAIETDLSDAEERQVSPDTL